MSKYLDLFSEKLFVLLQMIFFLICSLSKIDDELVKFILYNDYFCNYIVCLHKLFTKFKYVLSKNDKHKLSKDNQLPDKYFYET